MGMKCCTIGGSSSGKGGGHRRRGRRGSSKLGKAAKKCKGKTGSTYKKCVKAKIRNMR